METCKICNKELKTLSALSLHIKKYHTDILLEDYYKTYIDTTVTGICPVCKINKCSFLSLGRGYNKNCSLKCSNNNPITKQSKKETTFKNYGVEHPLQNKDIQSKMKDTQIKNHGSYFFESEHGKKIVKQSYIDKFGVDNVSKLDEVKEKKKQTFIKKYGYKTSLQHPDIIKQIEQTNLNRYGYIRPSCSEEIKNKRSKTFWITIYNRYKNNNKFSNIAIPLFNENDFIGSECGYLFKCCKCNNIFYSDLINGMLPRCNICNPRIKLYSSYEINIIDYLSQYTQNIIRNDRTILEGKELDIYLPDYNLAIEFNGLYWHSELINEDKNYHLNKTIECAKKNIQLIHIFEDEWVNKQDIVKSIILSKLNKIENKIHARKCIISIVNNNDAENFIDNNHLQGFINGTHIGLYYNNEIVSILTIGKSRFDKNYDYEILRFCNKINTIVIGGLSKLLKYIKNNFKFNTIITYCDLRYGTGDSYTKCGFEYIKTSKPNYYYFNKINNRRENRINYQKHKLQNILPIFDPILTEWENMQLNGYSRIWDCGNNIFVYKN